MLNPGERVLIALSGGPDSVCLLSVLHTLTKDYGLQLHVAHLDHRFRGRQSADEAAFVGKIAQKFGIPATIEAIDVPAYCRERGLSAQEGARQVRYDFLQRTAQTAGASRIATGHTADDQAETFLMRLIRGAGVAGLSAIPPIRGNIIRPLIEVTRQEVMDHLSAAGLEFATDPTNAMPVYTRNRIRLEVIPVLKRFNPGIVETLASEADLLREEDSAIKGILDTILEDAMVPQEDALALRLYAWAAQPRAFQRRLLRMVADRAGTRSASLSMGRIEEALSFMQGAQSGRTMNLAPNLCITREYDKFVFFERTEHEGSSRTVRVPGTTALPDLGVEVGTFILDRTEEQRDAPGYGSETADSGGNYRWQARFDYDKISPPFVVRFRQPGDRFYPSGMGGRSKKLQDYLVDEKIPRRQRDRIPLLCSGKDILWVMGCRTDDRFLVDPETKRTLFIGVRSAS